MKFFPTLHQKKKKITHELGQSSEEVANAIGKKTMNFIREKFYPILSAYQEKCVLYSSFKNIHALYMCICAFFFLSSLIRI